MKHPPPPAPILDLIDIFADRIVAEHLAEMEAERAMAVNDESNTSAPRLARTGTDGE